MSRVAIAAHITAAAIAALGCALAAQTTQTSSSTQTTPAPAGAQAGPATSPAGSRTISGVVVSGKNSQPLAEAEVSLSPAGSTEKNAGGQEEKTVSIICVPPWVAIKAGYADWRQME